jgi:2'-5' RNA ligase
MTRLFIAVWPPEEVVDELTHLHRKDQRGVRFVSPDRWHITLRFLGEAHADAVAGALDDAHLEVAHAQLGPAVDVLAERALIVPVTGLDQLAAAVDTATHHLGERTRRRFTGHLTIARVKPDAPMPRTLGALVSAEFDVEEIALVSSRLHPDGARYETIGRWPVG